MERYPTDVGKAQRAMNLQIPTSLQAYSTAKDHSRYLPATKR